MFWFKFHIGDYNNTTHYLSWDEDCAYKRLLFAYYGREGPLHADEVFRQIRAVSEKQKKATKAVLEEFFTLKDNHWHNKRADAEIAAYQEQARINKRIAVKRWTPKIVQIPPKDSA